MEQSLQKSEPGFKKRKSILKGIGIAVLLILLAPVLLAGLLYLYVNVADFQYDNPDTMITQEAPMSFSQRHSFDAETMTRTMRLDKTDLYYLTNDIMPDLHYNESLFINAYRISLEDKAVYLQGKAYGINIPVRVGIDLQWRDGDIMLAIKDAHLGKLSIPIPVHLIAGKLGFDLDYTMSLQDNRIFKDAQELFIDDDVLKVVYPVDKHMVSEGFSAWTYLKPAEIYMSEEDGMITLVSDIQKNWTKDDYVSPKLVEFVKKLEQDPDAYQELIVKLLALSPGRTVKGYFSSSEYDQTDMTRFYPGVTQQAVDEMRTQTSYIKNFDLIKKYAFDIDERFGNGTITVRKGHFINTEDQSVIDFNTLLGDSPEAEKLFSDKTKLCAILCEGAQSTQIIGRIKYGCGTAVQFENGRCVVICRKGAGLYFNEIPSQEFEDLASGKSLAYIVSFTG